MKRQLNSRMRIGRERGRKFYQRICFPCGFKRLENNKKRKTGPHNGVSGKSYAWNDLKEKREKDNKWNRTVIITIIWLLLLFIIVAIIIIIVIITVVINEWYDTIHCHYHSYYHYSFRHYKEDNQCNLFKYATLLPLLLLSAVIINDVVLSTTTFVLIIVINNTVSSSFLFCCR